jgi:hypothetical protein
VIDRGFVTSESQAYAIYLSTPEDQWSASLPIFQTAADSFQSATGQDEGDEGDEGD